MRRYPAVLPVLCALLSLSHVGPAGAAFNLGVRLSIPLTDVQPQTVATADLNGDGNLDLVTSNTNGNSISVFLGDGHGVFTPHVDYPTGLYGSHVAIGDVNGDGRLDAVVVNYQASSIAVLLGNGAGGFGPRTTYPVGVNPSCVAIGDLNGDGRADVVVSSWNSTSSFVSVLLGTPAGTLGPRTDFTVAGNAYAIALADLNGDGRLDLACSNTNTLNISVLLGNGDGTFGTHTDYPLGAGALWVTAGDLNNDGKVDLVGTNATANTVSVLMGIGDGTFAPKVDYPTGASPVNAVIGDVDGDGIPDIVTANSAAGVNTVSVLIGTGTGTFGTSTDFAAATQTFCSALGDVNGDGNMDIITCGPNYPNSPVTVLLGRSSGGFGSRLDLPSGSNPKSVALGDLNHDGKLDMVSANAGSSTVSVFLGNGLGGFGSKIDFATGAAPYTVAIADLNLDGNADLVVANNGASTVSVLLGNGAGGFGPKSDFATGANPWTVAVGDLNRDGKPDLAVGNMTSSTISVLLGNGAGGFTPKTDFVTGLNPKGVAIGDLNGDGKPDLVTSSVTLGGVSVLLGDGAGGFGAKTDFATGTSPYAVAIGDLNGDGRQDLATVDYSLNVVSTFRGNGAGGFGTKTDYPTGFGPYWVAIGDLNGDGRPDLAVATAVSLTVSVLLGDGAGGFGPRTDIAAAYYNETVAIGDVNGDGRPDLAVANGAGNLVSVFPALAPSRLTLVPPAPDPSVLGAPFTLTATVAGAVAGAGQPTGSVRFFDGTTLLGTSPVSAGVAALSVFAPRPGSRALSAAYYGDAKFTGSFAPARSLRVVPTASPVIARISDIANDQGGNVRVRFRASPFDYAGSATPITQYEVYRRIAPGLAPARAGRIASLVTGQGLRPTSVLLDGWDLVGTAAAHTDSAYNLVVPTLADSNASGFHRASLIVRAATAIASVYFDSPADSGYSVDNLPPAPPAPFTAAYAAGATHLHWGANTESDLWYYRVYRGSSAAFVPSPGSLIAASADTGYADAGAAGSYYKLSAVDVNGNESGFAVLAPGGTTGVGDPGATAFALTGVTPNPATGGRLSVAFALPSGEPATLELLDVAGRRVAGREVGSLGAGRHAVDVAPAGRLPAGLYLVRLTQGGASRVARVSLIE